MSDSPIRSLLSAIDALDLDRAMSLVAPDAELAMVYGLEAKGAEQVRAGLGELIGELRHTEHTVTAEWNPEPGVWIAEGTASYELRDFSRQGPFKRMFVVRVSDGLIERFQVFGAHEQPLSSSEHPYQQVRGPHGWLPTL